jgi:hypothetical protein
MKNTILAMTMILAAAPAYADGFRCETLEGDLAIKVYNHTQPAAGTRNGAVMVVSDPAVSAGRKTIASFTDVKTTLSNSGAYYVADVDLRVAESRRGGELISGTKLKHLDQLQLDVNHNYRYPVEAGEPVDARLTLVKRDGKRIERQMECVRYLKQ